MQGEHNALLNGWIGRSLNLKILPRPRRADYFFPSQPRARSQSPARSGQVATASPVRRNP